MNKRTLFIVGGIVAALLLCACVAVAGFIFYNASKTAEAVKTELEKIQEITPEAVIPTIVLPTEAVATPADAPAAGVEADEAANIFLRYLGNQQYEDALAASSTELRSDSKTVDLLREIVEDKGLQPQSWEWNETEVNQEKQETYLTGIMTYADGRQGTVEVQLRTEDGRWMVFYMDLKAEGSSDEPVLDAADLAQVSADVFVQFWKDGDYAAAFEMGSQAFKEQVGTPEKLEEVLGGTGLQVDAWTWDTTETFKMKDTGVTVIQWNGTGHFQNSMKGPIMAQLVEEDGAWYVLYFDVKSE